MNANEESYKAANLCPHGLPLGIHCAVCDPAGASPVLPAPIEPWSLPDKALLRQFLIQMTEDPTGVASDEEVMCHWCGGDKDSWSDEYSYTYYFMHESYCIWVAARRFLGHDIAPHKVAESD